MSALDLDALERRARKGLVLSPDETLALITRLRAAEARSGAGHPRPTSSPKGETTIRRCAATLLDASYTDGIPTETTDVWRTIAADAARDLTDMIRRLRAAEGARDDWRCEVEALQAERDTARVEAGRLRECLRVLTREHDAIITRLRAAEARTVWTDSLALQAHSMATAIEQGDEDGELDALGPVTAAIIRSDVARMLEIVAERPAPLAARTAWQPIETAPRDGTAVLVWWLLSTSDAGGIACFNGERWTQRDGLPYTWAPTHWQPLPAAPEAP